MLLKTKAVLALTGVAVAGAAGGVTATRLRQSTQTVVPATAYADVSNSAGFTSWFEPSGALVLKDTPGCANADDRLVVRTDKLHYRDGTADTPHEVGLPRPAGTGRLGTDSQVARLKDGRLVYIESGKTATPFEPAPGWEDFGGWERTTFEVFVSACGDEWSHALTIDTKDFAAGACAWPQHKDGAPRVGGFDRAELYVDPYSGDVFVTTACRGGTAPQFAETRKYRRMLLFRLAPDVSDWTLLAKLQLNYGVPIAMTSTSDGSLYLLRCDYLNRPQLFRLADRGERLVSVTDVQRAGESTAAARCARDWDVPVASIGQRQKAPELALAPGGPRNVRVAYQQTFDGRPQVRYYDAAFPPLPAGSPCDATRKAYLAQFKLPDDDNVLPFPECGPAPSFGTARIVRREGGSVVHFDLIEPDSSALASSRAMASSVLYWMEHDPATGQREVRYVVLSADGSWSQRRTISAAPWVTKVNDPNVDRDGDYEYGGYAFAGDRCRYALVWNQTHDEPAGPNLFAHYAIVDDLACTGTLAEPSPTPTTAPPTTAPPTTVPPTTPPPPSSAAPTTAPPTTAAPTGPPATSAPPKKFSVAKVTLTVNPCTQGSNGKWTCAYDAKFTFDPGQGGTVDWHVAGTLKHGCYPAGGGADPFKRQGTVFVVQTGQTAYSAGGYLTFDQAPNPPDVGGAPGQPSTAYAQVVGGPRSDPPVPFYSNASCAKP